ncbi:MAG: hypothetical protein PHC61_07065 [Chitinivibrionales bacterium]|nr:hypothetical protein [Chitinivibrionales bacterium]
MPDSAFSFFPHTLMALYAGSICCLNVILYLIATFYQRKFNEASPSIGFIIGGLLAAGVVVSVFIPFPSVEAAGSIRSVLLFGAAVSSGSATAILYFIMRRSKK